MGQCAPSSPLKYSLDDDEMSFVVTTTGAGGCNVGLPLQRIIFQSEDRSYTNKTIRSSSTYDELDDKNNKKERKNFLQAHQPDIPQRCIVNQNEIKRAVWLQSDEILRRQGMLKMHGMSTADELQNQQILSVHKNQSDVGANVYINEGDGDRRSMLSELSVVSSITSASTTTKVTTNWKKMSTNGKKISDKSNGPGRIYPSTSAATSLPSSNLGNVINEETKNFNAENDKKQPDFFKKRPVKERLTFARADFFANKKTLNINSGAVSDPPSIPDRTTGKDLEKYQCMSVLQLKMKANIGWFYTQRYLTMFPSEPKPIIGTVPKIEGDIPGLTCESLDNSFSSSSSGSNDHTNSIHYGFVAPITPVTCPVTNRSSFDLAITGCLGLVPREEDHKALRSSRRQLRNHYEKSSHHCVTLINKRSGYPLAVCVMRPTSGSPVVRIYATRQMVFAQKSTATTRQLGLEWADDLPLYAWAEVKSEGDFPDKIKFTAFMIKCFDGRFSSQPSYQATFDGHPTDDYGTVQSPVIKMVGRTDSENSMSGCALISIQADETTSRTQSESGSNLFFRINLAQGIDPAFLICFTAIVDEILEKSMRTLCLNQTRRLIRKDSFSLSAKRLEARSLIKIDKKTTGVPCKAEVCTNSHCIY